MMIESVRGIGARLETVYALITAGRIVADIGTDHGLLPLALLQTGKAPFVYACDLRSGPLQAARQQLSCMPADRWQAVLCDGLAGVPLSVGTVVLAGMGDAVILGILRQAKRFFTSEREWIIQPMSGHDKLRTGMAALGFSCDCEVATREKGHLYTVMRYHFTGASEPISPCAALCGKHLTQLEQPFSLAYVRQVEKQLEGIISGCAKSAADGEAAAKSAQAESILAEIQHIL